MKVNFAQEDLIDDPVGDTILNERCVTVKLGKEFVYHFNNDISEISPVLPYYGFSNHNIYSSNDNTNAPSGVIRDYNTIEFNGRNVFCLDTTSETIDVDKAYAEANSLLLTYTNKQEEFESLSTSNYDKFYYYRDEQNKWHYTEAPEDLKDRTEVLLFIHKNL